MCDNQFLTYVDRGLDELGGDEYASRHTCNRLSQRQYNQHGNDTIVVYVGIGRHDLSD
ncbi:MAG: hypothetical protein OXG05_12575 [Gammaproteobacteria bacterium]|nr:hypothetical protein [Gammaproteobacteria bacterium]